MHILVLNCGSSSLKYQLVATSEEQIANNSDRALAVGAIERIGSEDAVSTFQLAGGEKRRKTVPVLRNKDAIQIAFDHLTEAGGPLKDPREIEAVGHRIVHGGEAFRESVLIDNQVLRQIKAVSDLAPLHNPHNLKGYYASRALLPNARQVAVFDTAFHQTLPPYAYLYGIPYELYTRDKLRRYGFHGTSHRYISWRYANLHGTTRAELKLITCHLGNGCSICAIDHGKSIDTSMGFTPMDGLLMGTRPGDLDAGAVLYLVDRDPMGAHGAEVLLNQKAGLAGISGGVSDMRDLLEKRDRGDLRARDAIDVFCYRLVKYIGSYITILKGADALIFSGGIGENSAPIRAQVCEGLGWLGIETDAERNAAARGVDARVSTDGSRLPVWVIPTNEELLIARDTYRCVHNMPNQ
jgi:acetate kinase